MHKSNNSNLKLDNKWELFKTKMEYNDKWPKKSIKILVNFQ